MQNLIVYPATGAATGVYKVHAGSRRLRILQKLAAEGVINADDKIPCKIEEPEDAAETSLVSRTGSSRIELALGRGVVHAEALDRGEDVVGGLGPSERLWIAIVLIDEGFDVGG